MKKKIFAVVLSLVMTVFPVSSPIYANSEQTEYYYYDLSEKFNTSIFANVGDTVLEGSTWGYFDGKDNNGFSATTNYTKSWWNTYYSKNSNYVNVYNSETGIFSYPGFLANAGIVNFNTNNVNTNLSLEKDIPYSLKSSDMNVTSKNAYAFGKDDATENTLILSGSKSACEYLNLLFAVGGNTCLKETLVTVKYMDNTTEEFKFRPSWAKGGDRTVTETVDENTVSTKYEGWKTFVQAADLLLKDGIIETQTTLNGVDTISNNLASAFRSVTLEIKGKAINEITVKSQNRALVAVTEDLFTENEFMDKYGEEIKTAWSNALQNPTIDNMKKMADYADTMDSVGVSYSKLDSQMSEEKIKNKIQSYRDKVSQIKDVDNVYYDLSSVFNTSIFGAVGDKVSEWGLYDGDAKSGFTASANDWKKTTASSSLSYSDNMFEYAKEIVNLGISATGLPKAETLKKNIPFKIDSTKLNAKSKNAYFFDGNSGKPGKIVLNGSGITSEHLNLLFAIGSNKDLPTYNITVEFTDGDKKDYSFKLFWARAGENNINGTKYQGWNNYCQQTDLTLTNGTIQASLASDSTAGTALRAIVLETGKAIKTITISAWNTALLAVTEMPLSYDEFMAANKTEIEDLWAKLQNGEETTANMTKMIAYGDAMEKNGIPVIFIDDTKDGDEYKIEKAIAGYKEKIVSVKGSNVERRSEEEVVFEFEFSNSVNAIANNISVLKNNETFSDFDFSVSGNILKVTIPETRNGGNKYIVTVKDVENANSLYSSYKLENEYTCEYTTPDYYTYSYSNGAFEIKNNSKDNKDDYVAYAVEFKDKTPIKATVQTKDTTAESLTENESVIKTFLWNKKQKTISNDSAIEKCLKEENKSADYNNPSYNVSDSSFVVEGYTPSKLEGKVVNVKLLDKKGNNDKIILADSIKSGKNGYFYFDWEIPESVYTSAMDIYVLIGGDDFSDVVTSTNVVYYTTTAEKTTLATALKTMTKDDIENDLTNILNTFSVSFAPAKNISKETYAKLIFENQSQINENKLADLQKLLKQLAIIGALNENKAELVFDEKNMLMYNDIMGYSEAIDVNGVTLFDIYKNSISESGISEIKNAVLSGTYKNENEKTAYQQLINAIEKAIFLNALNNPKNGGTGYITSLLTNANAQRVGVDVSKFVNTTDCLNYISAGKPYASIDVFNTKIKNYTAPIIVNPGSNSGSSSGGSSYRPSVSISGMDINKETKDNNTSNSVFSDLSTEHWAYNSIVSLVNKKLLNGKGDNMFYPESGITRGELVKIICEAYGLSATKKAGFIDTNGKWYEEYANIAFENGIIKGISDTEFGGDAVVTRQDLCVILYRLSKADANGELNFTDSSEIAPYAKNAVSYMVEKGIISGFSDGSFKPFDGCTRAQAAKILDLFFNAE